MQEFSNSQKKNGKTICFVPTMGFLHKGHISLLKKGRPLADNLVLSVFVNPTQFAPNEDLDCYPVDIENDKKLAKKEGVDVFFLPTKNELYGDNFQTTVKLSKLPLNLCGASRPFHFSGVCLIVAKLFNIVKPDIAIFGKKDYQQLAIIKQMVSDLNYDIKILGADIVREVSGLAMSSRNSYLKQEQKEKALSLFKSIQKAEQMVLNSKNKTLSRDIIEEAKKIINSYDDTHIDYLKICDTKTLEDIDEIKDEALFALAVKIGKVRLIDNTILKRK